MVDRAANGKPRRTDLSRHLEEVVYPALYDRLQDAFPEFAFAQRGAVKEATRWPAGFPLEVEHPRPERLQCYADSPYRLWVHGRHHLRWLDYVNGGRKPMGPDFLAAVRKLCDLAGVQFPEREVSAEEEEQARAWEMRRVLLATVLASCQEVLWSPRGDQARAYMGSRGFTDDDMKALGLGFYPGVDDLRSHLEANGHDARAADNCRLLVPELTGYIVLPWNDPSGGPMTLYGRWAAYMDAASWADLT